MTDVGGGAIHNKGNLTICNSTLSNNKAVVDIDEPKGPAEGGAIYSEGHHTIINSTLNNNTAQSGGAICNNGTLTIQNTTLNNNTAQYGGVIGNYKYLTIENTTMNHNTANNGGAIYNSGHTIIQNTTLNNNTAQYGGVIGNYKYLTIENTTMNHNTANNGGAIYNELNNALIMISDSIFSKNKANEGYVIEIERVHSNNTITNSQFYNNTDFTKDMLFDENHGNNINNIYISNYLETTSDTPDNKTLNLSDYNISIPVTTSEKYNTTINNGNFTVIINGKEYKKFVVENGSSNITIPLNAFNQTVNEVIYNYTSPDKSYQPLTLNNTVTLIKHDTNITIDQIQDTSFDNKVNVTGTLRDANGTAISNATVTINNINVTTDADGRFTTQINANPGVNNATVKFNGNTYYNKSEKTMTFNGLSHNTTIIIDQIPDTPFDNKVNITGTLKDTNGTSISNATVTVNNINVTTDTDGVFTIQVNADLGVNNVTVSYAGDNQYNNIANTTTFNGIKHEVLISIDEEAPFDSNMTGTLKDVNGTVIPNVGIILVMEDLVNPEVVTNSTGGFTLPIKINLGNNYLKDPYKGLICPSRDDDKYERKFIVFSTSGINVIGLPHNTTITIDQIPDTPFDNKVNITGTLNDVNGTSISNATVTVNNINVTTDTNGRFTTQVNTNLGVNNITVKFDGNTYYNKSEKTMTFNGIPHNTTITIDQIPDTPFDNKVNITGILKDANGTSISNVTITVNNINVTTDTNGRFITQINANLGVNSITVKFDGNNYYSKSEKTMTFNGLPHNTTITIDQIPDTPFDNKVNIIGTLKDVNGTSISNVTITVNNINVTTNINGIFTTQVNTNLGVNSITVKFDGNTYYNKSEKTMTFNGLPHNTTITINPVNNTLWDNKVNVTGTLKDTNGTIISNTTVTVNDINVTTDINGIFTIQINANPGINNITVKFNGNNYYNKSEKTMTFNGIPHNTIITINPVNDTLWDNKVNITGTLKDTNGTIISNTTVTVNDINVTTDINGIFTIQINANPEVNNITVKFDGNNYYNKSEEIMTFNGLPHNTTITIDQIPDTPFDNKVNITGTLRDVNGTTISNATVTVNDINITTDTNGKFTTQVNTNLEVNNVTVKFDGNNYYSKSEKTMTFNGIPHNITITIDQIPDTLFDNKVNVTGTLSDVNGTIISNTTVTVNDINVITDLNGRFTTQININPGVNNVTVKFDGNNYYNKSEKTMTFNGLPHNTTITINQIPDTLFDNKVNVTGTLSDVNGTIISNTTVTVNDINVITDLNGRFTTQININPGINNVTVKFDGNNYYNKSEKTMTFKGIPHNTTITINPVNDTLWDNKVNITGTLRDANNTPIKNAQIQINNQTASTDENGIFTTTIIAKIGNNNITVTYKGNNSYNKAENTTTFNGLPHNSTITIDQIPDTPFDNKVNITGTLRDVNGTTISNVTVTINDINIRTDVDGIFTAQINADLGVNNITVKFNGNNYYDKSEETITFNGIPHNSTIIINPIPDTPFDNKVNITGTLKDANGTSICNETVIINDINIRTDVDGRFTTQVNADFGVNNITVKFNENNYYNKSEKTITFNGLPHNSTITVNPVNDTLWDNKINITGVLKDVNNTSISNATINIKVNDKTYNTTTNNKGEYNLIIQAIPGLNNITVNYNGNNMYNKSQITTSFNGVKHETNTSIDPVKGLLGKNVTFTAHVTDINGTLVNEGYVIFKVNGITIKDSEGNPIRVNVTNGTATLTTIAAWDKATNTTVSYSGNEKFKASKADGTINITRQNVTVNLTIQNNGLKPGEILVAIVNVTDMDNKPVKTGNVLFKMNGKTMKYTDGSQVRINVTNGTVTLHYAIPEDFSAKNYTLTAVYTGNIYNRAETTTNFTLTGLNAKIKMTVDNKNLKPGSTLIAVVNVTDDRGNPITRGYVTFKLNNKTLTDLNGNKIIVDVINGSAMLNYTIPDNYSAKTYKLSAVFGGSNYNRIETSQNITLNKISTYIQSQNIIITNNTLKVRATIMNNDTKEAANQRTQKVSIKLDKHTVIKEVTVQNGTIDLSTNINVKPGVHTVEIVTSGNGIYNSCRQNFIVNNQVLLTDNSNNLIKVTG